MINTVLPVLELKLLSVVQAFLNAFEIIQIKTIIREILRYKENPLTY